MKRVILVMLVLVAAISVNAQDKITRGDANGYVWNTAADTLIENETLDYTFRITGKKVMDLRFGLEVDSISGTVTNNFVFYGSMDNVNFESTGDTIAHSDAADGSIQYKNLDDFNWPYLKVSSTAGATAQKAKYKLYYIFREE